jgi:Spy/CpxP family protein refolding chaperone
MSGIQGTSLTGGLSPDATSGGSQTLRPFANLNLTEDQRTKIRSILQQAKAQGLSAADVQKQINGVLTTDQQTTLQSDVQKAQSAPSGHHHHHHGSGGGSASSSSSSSSAAGGSTPTGTTPSGILAELK